MKRRLPKRIRFLGIEINIRPGELSIQIGNRKITIKTEKNDPNLDTRKIKKDDKK